MCCMPVPVLYLCMSSLIAAPVYMMLLAKAPVHGPINYSLFFLLPTA